MEDPNWPLSALARSAIAKQRPANPKP